MKYAIILCDGMADEPVAALQNRTPLEAADTPHMDALAKQGVVGTVQTVPRGMAPGSDVANLSVLGYDPAKYYTGRSSLEALARGLTLQAGDVSYRANLVTLSDAEPFESKTLVDFSAGEVSNEDAAELIEALKPLCLPLELHKGISYRNLMLRRQGQTGALLTPPHDIQGQRIAAFLPQGSYAGDFIALMKESCALLSAHPVNKRRIAQGKNPANALWFWGEGTAPVLPQFTQLRKERGAIVCAVDLLRGIGAAAGMEVVVPETATGGMVTDYRAKGEAALRLLQNGSDLVFVHIEAPDECGHHGDPVAKAEAISQIDRHIVGRLMDDLGEPFRMLVLPDHPTPVRLMTHTGDPVPFVLYDSTHPQPGVPAFNEQTAAGTGLSLPSGEALMGLFLAGEG